jgi:Ca2+-binding EF-hand superfamily protein
MLFKDTALLDRIFRVFDTDDDNQISFQEYVSCLAMISSKASKEDKLKCKKHKFVNDFQ